MKTLFLFLLLCPFQKVHIQARAAVLMSNSARVVLDGSKSYDPDGYITRWQWRRVSGPRTVIISKPRQSITAVSNLIHGVYVFSLTVTDNGGASASDSVTVTIK